MKFIKLLSVVAIAFLIVSCGNKTATKADLKTELDSVSYALGMDIARNVESNLGEINDELFYQGYLNGLDSTKVLIDKNLVQNILQKFFQKKREEMMKKQQEEAESKAEAQYGELKAAGEKFLQNNLTNNPDVLTTESGLQYIVLKEGTGKQPSETSKVKVHYHGTTIDGTVFDSSVDRGEPSTFGVNQVIKGWTEGLQLMKEGAKYKFFIPQDLAYGFQQRGQHIKPFSTLIFEVELLEVQE